MHWGRLTEISQCIKNSMITQYAYMSRICVYVARRRRILDHMLRKRHMLQDGHGDSEEVQEEEEKEEDAGDLA